MVTFPRGCGLVSVILTHLCMAPISYHVSTFARNLGSSGVSDQRSHRRSYCVIPQGISPHPAVNPAIKLSNSSISSSPPPLCFISVICFVRCGMKEDVYRLRCDVCLTLWTTSRSSLMWWEKSGPWPQSEMAFLSPAESDMGSCNGEREMTCVKWYVDRKDSFDNGEITSRWIWVSEAGRGGQW